jgi:hypothetical protein
VSSGTPWAKSTATLPANLNARLELRLRQTGLFQMLYPETGPLRRDLYWWAQTFWNVGAEKTENGGWLYPERGIMAANQVGKTIAVKD